MARDHLPMMAGPVSGPIPAGVEVALATGETVNGDWSGRFYTLNAAGYAEICGAADQTISGWLECGDIASGDNTANGLFKRKGIISTDTIFRIPTDTVFAQTHVGQFCDLEVDSTIQRATVGTSTNDLIQIVGGYTGSTAAESWVDVIMNVNEMYSAT